MNITLNDLLMVTAARRIRVTVTLTRTLTATIQVDANDLSQWDELSAMYGGFTVKEISPADDALCLSLTPPAPRKGGD